MNTSVANEMLDQDDAAPSNNGYYPLLGLALIVVSAAVTYGPLLYAFGT